MVFKEGTEVSWSLPFIKLGGVLRGDRTIKYHGVITFVCPRHCLKAVIRIGGNTQKEGGFMGFGATQKSDVIKGYIY